METEGRALAELVSNTLLKSAVLQVVARRIGWKLWFNFQECVIFCIFWGNLTVYFHTVKNTSTSAVGPKVKFTNEFKQLHSITEYIDITNVYFSSYSIHFHQLEAVESIPAGLGRKAGHTPDRSPIHYRAEKKALIHAKAVEGHQLTDCCVPRMCIYNQVSKLSLWATTVSPFLTSLSF